MRLLVTSLLLLGIHFALTAVVPARSGKAWLGWPFATDSRPTWGFLRGPTGALTAPLAVLAAAGFLAAGCALYGIWIPAHWWAPLVVAAASASALLYLTCIGRWALLPLAVDVVLLWGVVVRHWSVAGLGGP